MEKHKSRHNQSKEADGKSRCDKSAGSRWSVKLDKERIQLVGKLHSLIEVLLDWKWANIVPSHKRRR